MKAVASPAARTSADAESGLEFLFLLPDGAAIAKFADSSLLMLNCYGVTFRAVQPDGTSVTQLTACATRAYRRKVEHTLHVRNVLGGSAPFLCWELLQNGQPLHYLEPQIAIRTVRWPGCASPRDVLRHPDGAIRVISLDRLAWLLLHPLQHTFVVCFPAPVNFVKAPPVLAKARGQSLPPQGGDTSAHGRYVFVKQLYSTFHGVPSSWEHALHLARATALEGIDGNRCTPAPDGGWVDTAELIGLSPAGALAPPPVHSPAVPLSTSLSRLVSSMEHDDENTMSLEDARWGNALSAALPLCNTADAEQWMMPSQPGALALLGAGPTSMVLPEEGAQMLLTPHALFRLGDTAGPEGHDEAIGASGVAGATRAAAAVALERPSLALTLLQDDTQLQLSSNGRFWHRTVKDTSSQSLVYAVGAIPPTLRFLAPNGAPAASLSQLAALGIALWEQQRRLPAAPPRGVSNGSEGLEGTCNSAELLVEAEADGLGRFRRYADGRISVLFVDRTVLTMVPQKSAATGAACPLGDNRNKPAYLCHAVLPNGHTTQVHSDRAIGLERYVHVASDFAQWAARSPKGRLDFEAQACVMEP